MNIMYIEIHRVRVDLNSFTFMDLEALFQSTFHLDDQPDIVIQFFDASSSRHSIESQEDFLKACVMFYKQDAESQSKALRFVAQSRVSSSFTTLMEPLIKVMQKILKQLTEAIKFILATAKASDLNGTCKRSLQATNDALLHAAEKTKTTFDNCKTKASEIQFKAFLHETAETMKLAAQDVSCFATDLASTIKADVADFTTQFAAVAPLEPTKDLESNENDVKIECAEESMDKEVVQDAIIPVEQEVTVEDEQVAMEDGVMLEASNSDEEDWEMANEENVELAYITEAFPNADKEIVESLLVKYDNNAEMVMNVLMDM
jgi:hypothetical protein